MDAATLDTATALPAHERILATAHELFYRDGIRATGVDRLIAESGVAKLTFYRHFPSKNELVLAFLDERHARWMAWFVDALGRHGARSSGGLAPVVRAMAEWWAQPAFRGCAFINAVAELGDTVPGVMERSRRHKEEMTEVISGLLPTGQRQALLARAAAQAVDGAILRAQMDDAPDGALEGLRCSLGALAPL